MIIGTPKETKELEYRVTVTPSAAYQLIKRGHSAIVETQAGADPGLPDENHEDIGATIVSGHAEVFERADLIVKVKESLPAEDGLLRRGQLLFTYPHLAANRTLTEALMTSGVTALAYETIETNRRLPLLEPMSEIAGRISSIVGAYYLAKHAGCSGVLLGGVPGVFPGTVVMLAGVNAATMATGLGADVTILEVDLERMRFLDITLHSANKLFSNETHLMDLLPKVGLLIGAVLVPGAKAPKLISREMLRGMRPGSVLVDNAVDQGGCAETTRPTTSYDPPHPDVCRGRCHSLLRGKHARGLCADGHASPHQRHPPLYRVARRQRPCRSLSTPVGAGGRDQRHEWSHHQQGGG